MEISLQTSRLIIRPMRDNDLEDFVEYRSDPNVCEFQGYQPMTTEKAIEFIDGVKDARFGEGGEWIQLCVELKDVGKMIGDIGLKPEAHEPRVVEFGISFSSKYQKKGYASEALRATLNFLFESAGIHRIIGITDVLNTDCIRLLENLKFRREAEYRQSFWDQEKQSWRDEFLFAILADEWA